MEYKLTDEEMGSEDRELIQRKCHDQRKKLLAYLEQGCKDPAHRVYSGNTRKTCWDCRVELLKAHGINPWV